MKYKAYGINLRVPEDIELIKKVCTVVTNEMIEIQDTCNKPVISDHETVLFLFGKKIYKEAEQKQYYNKVELPEVWKLDKDFGDPEERKYANELLLIKKRIQRLNQRYS